MSDSGQRADWVADPAIAWRIVLSAELAVPLSLDNARRRLAELHTRQGWPGTGTVREAADLAALRRILGDEREGVVSVGLSPDGEQAVISAHHSQVDGLGLLAVLSAMLDTPVRSSARGIGDRPGGAGSVGTVLRRLAEVAVAPPARIGHLSPADDAPPDPLDVYVERDVPGEIRTAALVVAGAAGVTAGNRSHGRRTRRVAVAVGVSRLSSTDSRIADDSALLRLRDVEGLTLDEVTDALRHTPTQRAVLGLGGSAGVMRLGLRALAPRLGSTLLVSHLGAITAPGVDALTFHPVTAGGTGVSLGAVTLHATTTTTRLTLRARGTDWTHDGLEQLLDAIVTQLHP